MFLLRRQRRPKLFGCVAVGLLLNWLVLTLGIPLPTWQAKDRSRPFPCMDSVCGCHSAEKCWRSCCCHTNQEKLAWAKRNGVTPPGYVVAAADNERCPKQSSQGSCCLKKDDRQQEPQQAAEPESKPSGQWVLSSVRRCQGNPSVSVNSELTTILISAESPLPVVLAGQWIELSDLRAPSFDLAPASPPPDLG